MPALTTLKRRKEFKHMMGAGVKIVTPAFVLYGHQGMSEADPFRFGLTVTRKIGNAVVRNRCKRRLRAVLQQLNVQNTLQGDCVIVGRHRLMTYDFKTLCHDLHQAMTKGIVVS